MAQTKKSTKKPSMQYRIISTVKKPFVAVKYAVERHMSRRPHRSFKMTRRRDYARSLKLPGYFAFTDSVRKTLWQNHKMFLLLALVYAVLTALLVGMASQDLYTTLSDTLRQTSGEIFSGNFGQVGEASLLFLTTITGGITQNPTEAQQVYAALIAVLTWLTTVWLLRNILAGHKVKLRDGLYNASSPLLSTFIVVCVLVVQLLPLAIAMIGYSAAMSSGLLSGGVEAMLFWIAAGLLALMSLYWITSTLIALVVVTLPGMYPFRAIKTAGDLVIGRRLRILLRLIWMLVGIAVAWALIMVPIILLDTWLKGIWPAIGWIPTVPIALLVMTSLTTIWSASYIYLLYRKVVEDDANPA